MKKNYEDIDGGNSFMKFELNPKIRYTETYCKKFDIFDVFQRKFIISNQYFQLGHLKTLFYLARIFNIFSWVAYLYEKISPLIITLYSKRRNDQN